MPNEKVNKVTHNKTIKRESLLESAFSLFLENGFFNTSISDIVKKAGVAKGTFYLYFRDKYDLRNHLIAFKTNQMFQAAYEAMLEDSCVASFEQSVIFMVNHICDQMEHNQNLILLISKHLSWGLFQNIISSLEISTGDSQLLYDTILNIAAREYDRPDLMLYMIIELVSGTSYNSILYSQPAALEELKPYLFESIHRIMEQFHKQE